MRSKSTLKSDTKKYIFYIVLISKCIIKVSNMERTNNENDVKFELLKFQEIVKNQRKNNNKQKMTSSYFVTKIQKNMYDFLFIFV